MLDREGVIRRNALDYLDDILVGAKGAGLEDEERVNIAMFLIEQLVSFAEDDEGLDLHALIGAKVGDDAA